MANNKIKINLDSLKTRREWKRHKVKDGHNVFRIGSPHGEASNGYAYRKWQIIWGLVDPESGRARPFASSMTAEKRCPITEYVAQLKKKAETLMAQLAAAGVDEDSIKERLSTLNKLISDLNPKTVFLYNAIDKSGELGLLELKSTAHKKMKLEMSQYVNDYNQDPTSLNSDNDDSGIWFDVTRTGEGRDTEYDVKKCQFKIKKPGGGYTYEDDRTPLPESIIENYDNLAYDLSAVYQVKSYDDLASILEANLPSIIEACPDADLTATNNLTGAGGSGGVSSTVKPVKLTSKPVTTRFDDADDSDDAEGKQQSVKPTMNASKRSVIANDDFLAEANALLDD